MTIAELKRRIVDSLPTAYMYLADRVAAVAENTDIHTAANDIANAMTTHFAGENASVERHIVRGVLIKLLEEE